MWVVKGPSRSTARTGASDDVKTRLFCLPYAGASAALYRGWAHAFPPNVDVCPVEFPGRLSRLGEAPFTRVGPLVDAMTRGLAPLLDVPFVIFGYSMGALVGFEWARHLERLGVSQPHSLVVGAKAAPHLAPRFSQGAEGCTDAELEQSVVSRYGARNAAVMAEPGLRSILLRMMRADLALLDSYDYAQTDTGPLKLPIVALGGDADHTVSASDVAAWHAVTSGRFECQILPGDHFFLLDSAQSVLDVVRRELGRLVPAKGASDVRRDLMESKTWSN